jgi:hypothetical protein
MFWRNRNHESCEKNATGTENTGIRRIPAGISNLDSASTPVEGCWTPRHMQSLTSCLHSPPPPHTQPTESTSTNTSTTSTYTPSWPHSNQPLLTHTPPKTVSSHSPKHLHIILPTNHPPNGSHPILSYHPLIP